MYSFTEHVFKERYVFDTNQRWIDDFSENECDFFNLTSVRLNFQHIQIKQYFQFDKCMS